jgi:hypothetical protein
MKQTVSYFLRLPQEQKRYEAGHYPLTMAAALMLTPMLNDHVYSLDHDWKWLAHQKHLSHPDPPMRPAGDSKQNKLSSPEIPCMATKVTKGMHF